MIEHHERLVYFAGDSGFGGHFAQIRQNSARRMLHMAPEEAVRAHKILGAKTSIAIHHGTFQLADDGIDTQQKQLMACRLNASFVVLKNGQFANFP